MRTEIKFRAWSKALLIMIEHKELSPQTSKMEFGRRATLDSILENDDYEIDVAMLKNEDGKYIFGNDIVKGKGFRGARLVVFNENGYSLKGFNPFFFDATMVKKMKVIGNVYQNPELLNK